MTTRRRFLLAAGLLAADLALTLAARGNPGLVERLYSRGFFPRFAALVHLLFGWLPFSVAELGLLTALLLLLRYLWLWLAELRWLDPDDLLSWFAAALSRGAVAAMALHLAFLCSWGLNYYRLPLEELLGLTIAPTDAVEIAALVHDIGQLAAVEREAVGEDSAGVALLVEEAHSYLDCTWYELEGLSFLGGEQRLRAKPVLISPLMSYTFITGFYFPYSGEANLNMNVPLFELPSTVTHELAHLFGIAREDEANYLSWLQSRQPQVAAEVAYSGSLRALVYTLNAAYRILSAEEYAQLWQELSPAVVRDLNASRAFWDAYRGQVQTMAQQINDDYLKSNDQSDGVLSYDRFVDLLLAEWRSVPR